MTAISFELKYKSRKSKILSSKLIPVCLLFLFVCLPIRTQEIQWKFGLEKTLVYEINNKEALKLLKSHNPEKVSQKMFHSPVGTFTESWDEQPERGHFIFATIHKNKLHYRYHPVIPFQVFLFKEYGALTLQVVDKEGAIRSDAKVKLNNYEISFDKESNTYSINEGSEKTNRILTVELDKFRAIFDLEKHVVNPQPFWNSDYRDDRPQFYSYMITDKNKYKPGEKIRFKSYALTGNKRPLKKELNLWMRTSDGYNSFKQITTVSPYNPGGYAGEVLLHDSLKLKLDKSYTLQLRDDRNRVIASSSFIHEDYELYGNKLSIALENSNHYYPHTNELTIEILDANGLPLQGVEAEIVVKRKNVLKSYTDVLSLPDTLLLQHIVLDNSAPTTFEVPADIFNRSDCTYEISVTALTFDNQRMQQSVFGIFYHSAHEVDQSLRGDSVVFTYLEAGNKKTQKAMLRHNAEGEWKPIELPYIEKFNQALTSYEIKIPDISYETQFFNKHIDTQLALKGDIEKDSLNLTLHNPFGLECSWYIYEGNRLIEKGAGNEMDFKWGNVNKTSLYYAEVFYFIGKTELALRKTYQVKPQRLSVELDIPERIYPGQQVESTVRITNHMGRPVSNVDLTALAVNTQLGYHLPELPDYSPQPPAREQRSSYSINLKESTFNIPLDYAKYKDMYKLDTIPYYRFTYPHGEIFTHTVNTPDSTTQFAPYVMKNGEEVKIHVIEVNNRPVYFSWTEHLQSYSFLVHAHIPRVITLRLHDRAIVLKDVKFEPGKKTILSIDMDHLPSEASVLILNNKDKQKRDIFTPQETKRFTQSLARFPIPEGTEYVWFKKGKDIYPIYHTCLSPYRKRTILAGPLPEGVGSYTNGIDYAHEGGFSYKYAENVVYKYPDTLLIPKTLNFTASDAFDNLNDFNLTNNILTKLIEDCKRSKYLWNPEHIYVSQPHITMNITVPTNVNENGVANFLFENTESKEVFEPNILTYSHRLYPFIPKGVYNLILLYNDGSYLKKEKVTVNPYSWLDVTMKPEELHERDTDSDRWLLMKGISLQIGTSSPQDRVRYVKNPRTGRAGNLITGYIVDPFGDPVIGATIYIKGTNIGTVSNLDGYFELVAGKHETICISYIGYKTQEIPALFNSTLTTVLEEDSHMLQETIVIGYGATAKQSFIGSVRSSLVNNDNAAMEVPSEEWEDEADEQEKAQAEERLYRELLMLDGIRKNFSDVGFWEPSLVTNKKGEASFNITFPDNITKWDATVYAMNRKLQTGVAYKFIRSYKPIMAELHTPQFITVGDSAYFAATIRNYIPDTTINGETIFLSKKDTLKHDQLNFESVHNEKLLVHADNSTDSLTTRYIFKRNDGYVDGEERTIPVVQQGIQIATGETGFLINNKTVTVNASNDEEVHVNITANQLDVYMNVASYLRGYAYACNEQLASKLIGLLSYKIYTEFQGKKFTHDKSVNSLISRLQKNRNKNNLWSWWGQSDDTSYWMSAHILRALAFASESGYKVDAEKLPKNFVLSIPYRSIGLHDIDLLHALSRVNAKEDYSTAVDTLFSLVKNREREETFKTRVSKNYKPVSYLKEKLLLWEILQIQGDYQVIDNIKPYLKEDVLGRVYCDDGKTKRFWYSDNFSTTLIAYRMIKRNSTLRHLIEPMQLYILSTKQNGWNTYRASNALIEIMPDLFMGESDSKHPATIELQGKVSTQINQFPYSLKLLPGEHIHITKKEGIPLIFDNYTYKQVTERNNSDAFEVKTWIDTPVLTAGVPVNMNVEVIVKQQNAEYVMIEVPIPAACSYHSKKTRSSYRETHREYFKEKTVIFCQRLPEGTYTFTIELLPRYTGKYILNPAKVELMYFPAINANNDLDRVTVKEK